jgi:hypothetical protein
MISALLALIFALNPLVANAADQAQSNLPALAPGKAAGIEHAQLLTDPALEYVSLGAMVLILIAVGASKGGQSASATNTN